MNSFFTLLLAGGLLAGPARAQQAALAPAPVLAAFGQAQPHATHVAWHRCPVGYEATFEQRASPGRDRLPGERRLRGTLRLTPSGELVESRLDVPPRAFPPLGHTTVNQRYPHHQLDRIVRVVNAQGEVTYETKICAGKDKNGRDKNCQTDRFDKDGRPLAN